jgi:hypothetical protein
MKPEPSWWFDREVVVRQRHPPEMTSAERDAYASEKMRELGFTEADIDSARELLTLGWLLA